MYILRIANLKRKYVIDKDKEKTVLDNIFLMFPETGLFSIVGKSGSGKSTLLNLIGLLEKPTNGTIYYKNQNIFKWDERKQNEYRNQVVGHIFQNYHLLENESVLYNIMLPSLIGGKNKKEAEKSAKKLLNDTNIDPSLYKKICYNLSGGEKERVAILRALINDNKIILADEPTGALDSKNSIIFMEILKEISKSRLVLLVSHNETLVRKYSNSIIHLKDGHIETVEDIKPIKDKRVEENSKRSANKKTWARHLSLSNFKRRLKRNIISIISLSIGMISSILIAGFSLGSKTSIRSSSYNQFDYGVSSLYKETTQNIPGSKISLVQMSRPSEEEISLIDTFLDDYYVEPNTDSLLPSYPLIKCGESPLEKIGYYPIYSFEDSTINKSLLLKGSLPQIDSSYEVVINKTAYEYLKKNTKSDPLGLELHIYYETEYHYYTDELTKPVITDYFIYEKDIHIVGVVDNFSFLSTPKIYYSYSSFKNYLQDSLLINLSSYKSEDISWYDRLNECGKEESLSAYSYRLFLKDYRNNTRLENNINNIPKPFKIDSLAVSTYQALKELINAASIGMSIFLFIAVIGTILILGIISYSSYSEDRKVSAILTCLGASKKDILSIYLYENLLIGGIALLASLITAPILVLITNAVIKSFTSFSDMITIPYLSFLGIPLLFPLLLLSVTFLVCLLSTYIPLLFSKKISPKEELKEE